MVWLDFREACLLQIFSAFEEGSFRALQLEEKNDSSAEVRITIEQVHELSSCHFFILTQDTKRQLYC